MAKCKLFTMCYYNLLKHAGQLIVVVIIVVEVIVVPWPPPVGSMWVWVNWVPLYHCHPATRETYTFLDLDKPADIVEKFAWSTVCSQLVYFEGNASTSPCVVVIPVWGNDVIPSAPVPPGGKRLWIIEIPWLAKRHYSIYSNLVSVESGQTKEDS